jgi:hypothetical protein
MRYPIEIAPKNGHIIVLEDETTGCLEVARWCLETEEWIGEYDETLNMTPSHWYPSYCFFDLLGADALHAGRATQMISTLASNAAENVLIMASHKRRGSSLRYWISAMVIAGVVGGVYLQRAIPRVQVLSTTAPEGDAAKARDRTTTTGLAPSHGNATSEGAQPKQSIESVATELRQSLRQEHDRAETLAAELAQVRETLEEKKSVTVEDSPAAKLSAGAAVQKSESEDKATETGPQRRRALSQNASSNCQHYRTYDPASGTYRGYDGHVHTCP